MAGESVVLEENYDENYEPTEDEIAEYAKFLGMDPAEDKDLLWIAKESLKAPLPSDWKPCQSEDGNIYYFNFQSGESVWDHPCDEHYKELYRKEKLKKLQMTQAGKEKVKKHEMETLGLLNVKSRNSSKETLAPIFKSSGACNALPPVLQPLKKSVLQETALPRARLLTEDDDFEGIQIKEKPLLTLKKEPTKDEDEAFNERLRNLIKPKNSLTQLAPIKNQITMEQKEKELSQSFEDSVKAIRESYDKKLEEEKLKEETKLKETLQKLQAENSDKVEALKKVHSLSMDEAKSIFASQLNSMKASQEAELKALKDKFDQEKKTWESKLEEQAKVQNEAVLDKQTIKERYRKMLAEEEHTLKQRNASKIATIKEALEESLEKERSDLQASFDEQVEMAKKQIQIRMEQEKIQIEKAFEDEKRVLTEKLESEKCRLAEVIKATATTPAVALSTDQVPSVASSVNQKPATPSNNSLVQITPQYSFLPSSLPQQPNMSDDKQSADRTYLAQLLSNFDLSQQDEVVGRFKISQSEAMFRNLGNDSFDIIDELRMRVANEEKYLKNAKEFSAETEITLASKRQIDVDTARLIYSQDHGSERPKERVIEQENWLRASTSLPYGREKSISKLESGISETRMFIQGVSKSFAGSKHINPAALKQKQNWISETARYASSVNENKVFLDGLTGRF